METPRVAGRLGRRDWHNDLASVHAVSTRARPGYHY
jgi:hypothetical protein